MLCPCKLTALNQTNQAVLQQVIMSVIAINTLYNKCYHKQIKVLNINLVNPSHKNVNTYYRLKVYGVLCLWTWLSVACHVLQDYILFTIKKKDQPFFFLLNDAFIVSLPQSDTQKQGIIHILYANKPLLFNIFLILTFKSVLKCIHEIYNFR